MSGTYDLTLVVISCLLSILASFAALNISDRLNLIGNRSIWPWIAFGGCIMGLGIWSMHFVAMLAFHLPVAVGYDIPTTIASLLIAIAASAVGFVPLSRFNLHWPLLIVSAIVMGLGVAGMHYLGMQAMSICSGIRYQPWLVALSVLIAILASGAALLLAFDLRRPSTFGRTRQIGSAIVMGVAVCGMHYCGMAAASFERGTSSTTTLSDLPAPWLAGIVVTFSLVIFVITTVIMLLDARTNTQARVRAQATLSAHLDQRNPTR
ncbi:MHYT domain-containing protein [Burkholderia lata]|uniref:Integral membrane sensor signal transduction histidine kinase n=1 Tax=Burkholderia lata (strain ATCC 17760 / DSM 23089 / LMG 22485 / NCIMB 9086 / R18194 / 383) TaxID=482957 RepID=A0A6P2T8I6_BURL3|nr:MHYT domain-containing protein [Burkholderia lata]VWC57440.1 integral membrane sensor signal transduction histidine kinase [Burkholderia lata]